MTKEARRFDLSKFRDLDISSFTMKQITGHDIVMAAERCAMPDGSSVDDNTFGLLLRQQMIAGSIIEVDDQPIKGASCQAYVGWTARTRDFVTRAYDHINATTSKEREDFQKLLDGVPPASEEQTSEQT